MTIHNWKSASRLIILFLAWFLLAIIAPLLASESRSGISPDEALTLLKTGNERYSTARMIHPNITRLRMEETDKNGQHPYATIIGCSDSRVPLELIFDAGLGDIFVIRVAGNVADTDEAGSIEYGVDHLGTPVLIVLGHSKCGAVTAVAKGDEVHGNIPRLVDNIGPAVDKAREKLGNDFSPALLEASIVNNVWQSIEDLYTRSPSTIQRVREGKLKVLGAVYHLESGKVEWLGEHPQQNSLLKQGDTIFILPALTPSMFLTTGIILVLLIGAMFFFVSRKRIIKMGIKGRVYAAFLSLIAVTCIASIYAIRASSVYSSQHFTLSIIIMYVLIPAVIVLVFSFIFAGSILTSFRTIISTLKKEVGESPAE
ncbi:MAG: hypothetical protein CVV44_14075 [Spirochaetae bacterium HGW-Spirochaetae-1]|jgi:carbonic anhydrase|nr:MAG: hypothetical protein CVV44_14075 [Spirochaetae bacterium HGW-Spirochaetae-1]